MYRIISAHAWIFIILAALSVGHPQCSIFYGRPSAFHCRSLVTSIAPNSQARNQLRVFIAANRNQPNEVTDAEWNRKVEIPKFWSNIAWPNCRAVLLPTINASDGTISYDFGRYNAIQAAGNGISHYCVEALGMPGVEGTGGIDIAGLQGRLRFVLYAPLSDFENQTLADYKDNKPIGVRIDDDKDKNDGPPGPSSGQPPITRKRKAGGLGLMSSSGLHTRTRNIGDGWLMTYNLLISPISVPPAAADLESLYNGVMDSAADQISNNVNATENLAFKYGNLNLRLDSQAPISWEWINHFAAEMMDIVGSEFTTLFKAQAYSSYWDLPAVAASLTPL